MISKVLKGLECCLNYEDSCKPCPYMGEEDCSSKSLNDAINLIISQKEENERLEKEIERLDIELKAMRGAANSYKAEVEIYKSGMMANAKVVKQLTKELKITKAEAIKEFADRLKREAYIERGFMTFSYVAIENLVKEMTENDFEGRWYESKLCL